jgi:imidazole glycerol-phosphate synthase
MRLGAPPSWSPSPASAPQRRSAARHSSGRRSATVAGSSSREVTLLDYGAGNVRSVRNAIKRLGWTIKDVRFQSLPFSLVSGAPRRSRRRRPTRPGRDP